MSLLDDPPVDGADLDLGTTPKPVPTGPRRLTPWGLARRSWYQLTSMRTALILLFLLALASVPGSLLPQRTSAPLEVSQYFADHPDLAPFLDRLSAFDVFGSPWFAAIYLLLFISLVGCVLPRARLHARAVRAGPPRAPANLARLPESASWVAAAPEVDAVAKALRAQRFRVQRRDEGDGVVTLAGEKGYLREVGNLAFHLSLIVLLVGVALGSLFGYRATRLLVEGDAFSNTVPTFDQFFPGRLVDGESLSPFGVTLTDFQVDWQDDGKPLRFEALVDTTDDPDAAPRSHRLKVNDPVEIGGSSLYLLGHGYAPHVVVRDERGDVAFDEAVPCLPQDGNYASTCVIKVADAQPAGDSDGPVVRSAQLGFRGGFYPTAVLGQQGYASSFPDDRAPALVLEAFKGDLGLDSGVPQSVYELDTDNLEPVGGTPERSTKPLEPGDTWELPGGGSVEFVGVEQWATFQVSRDPGKGLALGAAIAVIAGLLLSLTVRRRRIWVRLSPAPPVGSDAPSPPDAADAPDAADRPDAADAPDPTGPGPARTVVAVGGLAQRGADAFAEEFTAVTERLRAAAPPAKE